MLLSSGVMAQDDDYMMELEGAMEEVTSTDTVTPTTPIPAQNSAAPETITPLHQDQFLDQIGVEMEGMETPGGPAVPENARDQFDSDLKDRMPGTFVLYKRLNDEHRAEVFTEYELSGDYLRVRRKIIELRKAR